MNLGHILFSFSGRINRAKWWLAVLIDLCRYPDHVSCIGQAMPADGVIALVAIHRRHCCACGSRLAAGAKRLHDLNRARAWLVLFIGGQVLLIVILVVYIVATIGGAALSQQEFDPAISAPMAGVAIIIGVLAFALWVWALIWFGCLRGTVGPNQYGPDPLEGREAFR